MFRGLGVGYGRVAWSDVFRGFGVGYGRVAWSEVCLED